MKRLAKVCLAMLAASLPPSASAETTTTLGEQRPVIEAVRALNSAQVKSLLSGGADPNLTDALARTALHYAAALGQPHIVSLLLQSNSKLNIADQDGFTPLMRAAQNGEFETVRLLLESGAQTDLRNENGQTALDLAREVGQAQIVQLLSAPK